MAGKAKGLKRVLIYLGCCAVLAFALAGVFNLNVAARQAGVLQASMPAAVISTLIAAEFEAEPKLVTGAVALSTAISPITLTLVIALLQNS